MIKTAAEKKAYAIGVKLASGLTRMLPDLGGMLGGGVAGGAGGYYAGGGADGGNTALLAGTVGALGGAGSGRMLARRRMPVMSGNLPEVSGADLQHLRANALKYDSNAGDAARQAAINAMIQDSLES